MQKTRVRIARFEVRAECAKVLPMKFLPTLLAGASLALASVAGAQTTQQLLSDAQNAFRKGDLAAAKRDFQTVNQLDPRNPTAIGFLRLIAVQEAKAPKGVSQEKQLAALVIDVSPA